MEGELALTVKQTKLNNLALLLKTTNNRFKWIAFPAIKGRKVLAAYAAKLFPQLKGITHDSIAPSPSKVS